MSGHTFSVFGVLILFLSVILPLDLGTVKTVWYFWFFALLSYSGIKNIDFTIYGYEALTNHNLLSISINLSAEYDVKIIVQDFTSLIVQDYTSSITMEHRSTKSYC